MTLLGKLKSSGLPIRGNVLQVALPDCFRLATKPASQHAQQHLLRIRLYSLSQWMQIGAVNEPIQIYQQLGDIQRFALAELAHHHAPEVVHAGKEGGEFFSVLGIHRVLSGVCDGCQHCAARNAVANEQTRFLFGIRY